jgi:hypothetical protein
MELEFNQRKYQTVILAALLYVFISRFVGDVGEEVHKWNLN